MSNVKSNQVFVPGGEPQYTYNPRQSNKLESKLKNYLDSPYKILSITGSTKSGKTVLVRKVLSKDSAIWISGGQIKEADDLWKAINDNLNLFESQSHSDGNSLSNNTSKTKQVSASFSSGIAQSSINELQNSAQDVKRESIHSQSRNIKPALLATKKLSECRKPLVIDDFHYVNVNIQLEIIRTLKDCIFEGVPIIIIAVPHRAYDAVRVEKEMTGRIQQLEIPKWTISELEEIATSGFYILNVNVTDEILQRIVSESLNSPHIIQDFCLSLCRENDITQSLISQGKLHAPQNWEVFFRDKANEMGKQEFDRLARGPRQRSDRKERYFKNGETGDIYKAVLYAISKIGAKEKIEYEEIRQGLKEVLLSEAPSSQEVGRVLEKMSEIAKEHIQGEPVLDWDKDYTTLYLFDPFFIYYLKWGAYQ